MPTGLRGAHREDGLDVRRHREGHRVAAGDELVERVDCLGPEPTGQLLRRVVPPSP
jgi:hypothetical protein